LLSLSLDMTTGWWSQSLVIAITFPFLQVDELSDAFSKTSCSCIDDWDYEQDEKVKVSYTLRRRLKILLMKLKMKFYEMIY